MSTIAERAREARIVAPAITIIGDVVRVRDDIEWLERRPLAGKRIVVTRARSQASSLSLRLREQGAAVSEMPAIRVEPLDPTPLVAALTTLSAYDWVVFASENAVEIVWQTMRDRGLDARSLGQARVAAIGRATADALLARGLAADVVPDRFVAESLVKALQGRTDVKGRRVLLPQAMDARDVLASGLGALGAQVDAIPIYRTVSDGAGALASRATACRRHPSGDAYSARQSDFSSMRSA